MALTKNVPRDASNAPLPLVPSITSVAVTTLSGVTSSNLVTFQTQSTLIEVSAISNGFFMKWGATASTLVFDEYIQSGATRHYVIPVGQGSAAFLQQATPATYIVIEK